MFPNLELEIRELWLVRQIEMDAKKQIVVEYHYCCQCSYNIFQSSCLFSLLLASMSKSYTCMVILHFLLL